MDHCLTNTVGSPALPACRHLIERVLSILAQCILPGRSKSHKERHSRSSHVGFGFGFDINSKPKPSFDHHVKISNEIAAPKTSLWDNLFSTIQQQILEESDILTRYLNNLVPEHEVKEEYSTTAREIWNTAIRLNFQGDLLLLPSQGLPDVTTGLLDVSSKSFYRKLCQLRPHLAGITQLKRHFDRVTPETVPIVFLPPEHPPPNTVYRATDLFDRYVPSLEDDQSDPNAEILRERGVFDLDIGKLFILVGCYGHSTLFQYLFDKLINAKSMNKNNNNNDHHSDDDSNNNNNNTEFISYCEIILPIAMEQKHRDIINTILKVEGINLTIHGDKALRHEARNGYLEIVKQLLTIPAISSSAGLEESLITATEHVQPATKYGRLDIVKLVLDLTNNRVIPKLKETFTFKFSFEYNNLGALRLFLHIPESRDLIIHKEFLIGYLIDAASCGYLEMMKLLFDTTYEFNWTSYEKSKAFIYAYVDFTFEQNTAFKSACTQNHVEIVKLLISLPNVDLLDSDPSCDDFLKTVRYGRLEVLKLVLDKVVKMVHDLDILNRALIGACQSAGTPFISPSSPRECELISLGKPEEAMKLCRERFRGYLDIVRMLLAVDGVDVTAYDNAAFKAACINGNVDMVKLLLKVKGVDPAANDNQAVQLACQYDQLEVVKVLMEIEGVDVNANENTALSLACQRGQCDVVTFLLGIKGVDVTAKDNAAIRMAIQFGKMEVVKMLFDVDGVDPFAMNYEGIFEASLDEVVNFLFEKCRDEIPLEIKNDIKKQRGSKWGSLGITTVMKNIWR
ncbi:hypothetical protein HDU76_007598 [Blyttiomyces sp. JEL0837]|nr:hypothetical protein HDU76_007598 [Blyttiomyces sp. JEL0837]